MKTSKSIGTISRLLIAGMLVAFCSAAFAQQKDTTNFAKKKELIEAQKVAYITQKLELTSAEAQAFWPVYNEYGSKKETILNANRENRKKVKDLETLTDKEAQAILVAQFATDEKLLSLKKEYFAKFEKVLPVKKVVKLEMAERDFKKVLLKMVKNQGHPKGPMMKK